MLHYPVLIWWPKHKRFARCRHLKGLGWSIQAVFSIRVSWCGVILCIPVLQCFLSKRTYTHMWHI